MNPKPIAVLILLFSLPALTHAEDAEGQMLFECQIFRIQGHLSGEISQNEGSSPLKAPIKGPPDLEQKKTFTFFTDAKFQVGENRLELGKKGWLWNGETVDLTSHTILADGALEALLMGAPRISIGYGQPAKLLMASDQRLEYFERREDGLFELKRLAEPTGLEMEVEGNRVKKGRIKLNLNLSLCSVVKRLPVSDVTLPVGRPVLQKREYKSELLLESERNYGILLHPGDGQGVLIVCFVVKHVD